ncbi:MAG: polyphosphate:AMP phosphotransferase [Elusimicrobiota bacterium]
MFETAELDEKVSKADYRRLEPELRSELVAAQKALAASPLSLVVLIGGVEGAGKTEFANRLLGWLDARGIEVYAGEGPTEDERARPAFWRFWRLLPPKGKCAVLLTSWYTTPIIDRVFKRTKRGRFDRELARITAFEKMLSSEGVVVVKLWMHLSEKNQKRRFKELEADPDTSWRVTARDWRFHGRYDRFRQVCEQALMQTNPANAPWHIIGAADRRFRDLTGARLVLEALRARLHGISAAKPGRDGQPRATHNGKDLIGALDLTLRLPDDAYKDLLETLQGRLGRLTRKLRERGRSLTLVFEGTDAAGKGGAIRRLTEAMDARLYRVQSVAAPTDEERAHPYLWRFWRHLPGAGRATIFDRSWYGRVLVERVEGFASPEEWQRAYGEINAFEEQLGEAGNIVLKFWLAISPQEQLKRFKDREVTPYKQYKITPDDWRNRKKWTAYRKAACEMIELTGLERAPWTLIEAEDKNWARIKILETVVAALRRELR